MNHESKILVGGLALAGLLGVLAPNLASAGSQSRIADAASASKRTMAVGRAAADVSVSDATIREVPPGQEVTALFMKVSNSGPVTALVAVKSSIAKAIELHNNVEEKGQLAMRPVEKVEIPANGSIELKPGGLHVMLIGLKRAIKDGESIPLTLEFADGSEKKIEARVVSLVKNAPSGAAKPAASSASPAPSGGHKH
jgi:hypothetical protein